MLTLIKPFIDICLFRGKPQDLPGSAALVWATAVVGVLTKTLVDSSQGSLPTIFSISVTHVIVFGATVWIALRLLGFSERWNQTMSAIYGTDALVRLIGWPVLHWFYSIKDAANLNLETQTRLPPEIATPMLLLAALAIWTIAIMTSILRHATQKPTGTSLMITLACQFASAGFVYWIFFGQIQGH